MKSIIVIVSVFLTGCSATTSQAYFNMAMANIAPGSWYTGVNTVDQINTSIREFHGQK